MENMNKTKVDLVTGFLGAGKTTFLEKYFQHIQANGQKIVIVENEFGKAGVDAELLKDSKAQVRQLSGGCICCGLKVGFHDLLIQLSEEFDRIVVEPSGIYTLEDFYDIMESPQLREHCEVGNILMIVDAKQLDEVDEESEKVLYSQLAGAGRIIVSKTQLQHINETEVYDRLQAILRKYGNKDRDVCDYVVYKSWDLLNEEDYADLMTCGYYRNYHNLEKADHSTLYNSTTVLAKFKSYEQMEASIRQILSGECGQIIRVKGFAQCKSDTYQVNCTPHDWLVKKQADLADCELNIIGRRINRKVIQKIMIQ